jgi:hypothetical protein
VVVNKTTINFNVSLIDKSYSQWAHRIPGPYCLGLNDKWNNVLHLQRNQKYYFSLSSHEEDYWFYFSADPVGGYPYQDGDYARHLDGTPSPINNGTMMLETTSNLPKLFYYHTSYEHAGGLVMIHDS